MADQRKTAIYSMNYWKLFLATTIFGGIFVVTLWILVGWMVSSDSRITLERVFAPLLMPSSGFVVFNFYLNFFHRGAALTLQNDGFRLPAFADEMIPWSAVQSVERSKIASVTGGVQSGGVMFRVNMIRHSETL